MLRRCIIVKGKELRVFNNSNFYCVIARSDSDEAISSRFTLYDGMRLLRGVYPEQKGEILHFVQNDRRRRARNDREDEKG